MFLAAAAAAVPRRRSVTPAVRAAQAIFLVPLGLLQLVASIAFSTADGLHGAQYALAAWAAAMGAAGVGVGLLLGTGRPGVRRLAVALLPAQAAFSLVKLTVYHESASFLFLGFVAAAALLLLAARER
jgi:hypothetical protein